MPTAGPSRLRNAIQSSPEDSDEGGPSGPSNLSRPRRAAGAVSTYAENDEEEEDDESMLLPIKSKAAPAAAEPARMPARADSLDSSDELSDVDDEEEEDAEGEEDEDDAGPAVQDDGGDPEDEEEDDELEDDEEEEDDDDDADGDDFESTTPLARQRIKVTLRKSPANNKKTAGPRARKPSSKAKKAKEDEEDDLGSDGDDFANEELALPKTARQLAKDDKSMAVDLQELPLEDKKTRLTEAELALRKSEVARRRRNQTEKKLEDDKIETINRLLKKQVGRTRAKADAEEGADDDTSVAERKRKAAEQETPQQLRDQPRFMFRYVSTKQGAKLGVPVPDAIRDQYIVRGEGDGQDAPAKGADEDEVMEDGEEKDVGPYWKAFDRAFGVTTEVGAGS